MIPADTKDEKFALFDFVNNAGVNDIKAWALELEKVQRAKLNARLDMLMQHGPELFPHVLTDTPTPGIQKLRIKGNVQLRPMLCKGPINNENEFTLLIGAIERGSRLVPNKANEIANERKKLIIEDTNRRCRHERVG